MPKNLSTWFMDDPLKFWSVEYRSEYDLTLVQFPNSVPVTVLLDRTSKFRRQVKQARLPKWPLHWTGLQAAHLL